MSSKPHLTIAQIEARHTEMMKRLHGVRNARAELSLPIVEGDADAGAKDTKLREKEEQYCEALIQLDAALVTARAREAEVRRAEQSAAQLTKAADVRARLEAFRQYGWPTDCSADHVRTWRKETCKR